MQPPACRHGIGAVAGLFRAALLWLQQIDVSAARDIERVAALAMNTPHLAQQRPMAIADGAEEQRYRSSSPRRTLADVYSTSTGRSVWGPQTNSNFTPAALRICTREGSGMA